MILSLLVTILLILILIATGGFAGFSVAKRKGTKPVGGLILGMSPCIVVSLAFLFLSNYLYVITPEGEVKKYFFVGNPTYTSTKGEKVPLQYIFNYCYLYNESKDYYSVKSVRYGGSFINLGNSKGVLIEPNELQHFGFSKIDYLLESPPAEISVEAGQTSATRHYLIKTKKPSSDLAPTIRI